MFFLFRNFVTSWCSLTFNRPSLRMTFTYQIQDVALLFRENVPQTARPLSFYKQDLQKTNPLASIRKKWIKTYWRGNRIDRWEGTIKQTLTTISLFSPSPHSPSLPIITADQSFIKCTNDQSKVRSSLFRRHYLLENITESHRTWEISQL